MVIGLKETIDNLKALDKKVAKKTLRRGLRSGCKVVQSATQQEAPTRTETLKKNIKVRSGGGRRGTIRMIVAIGKQWFTGKTFYAAFVAWGHRVGSRKLGSSRKEVKANDFMKRGFEKSKEQAVDKVIATIAEELA